MKKMNLILVLLSLMNASAWAADAVLCETGLESFEKTLHPVLVQNCAKCHGNTGDETPHSVTDARTAYQASRKLVDFINIQNSRFVVKVNQKHWLNYDQTQTGTSVDTITAAIQAWWDGGEKSCPLPYSFISTAVALPNPLPDRTSNQYASMSFDLSQFNASLVGCAFNLKIQRFTTGTGAVPGAFRVREPSIQCSKSVHVSRVRFLINNGTESYENLYEGIDQTITAASSGNILNNDEMILIERPGVNLIQLAIGTVTVSP